MKILLIGAVNQDNLPEGGEEFKNQLIVKFLEGSLKQIKFIDTKYWRTKPGVLLRLFFNIFFLSYDRIIISASSASTYRLLQILYYLSPSKLLKTIYLVIGGYFPKAVVSNIYLQKYYQNLLQIVVEGHYLKEELKTSGLNDNISVIPNFKPVKLNFLPVKRPEIRQGKVKFVFLSRISPSKGIPEIFDAVQLLQQRKGLPVFSIDFYGPVEDSFESLFFTQIKAQAEYCTYKGYLDLVGNVELSYQCLSGYDCMLFPTYWQGEGFPGVVVDAYIAGLPIIASDWNMNSEIIEEGRTGYLIEPKSSEQLAAAMEKIMLHPDKLKTLRENSLEKAKAYHYKDVLSNQLLPLIKAKRFE